jgi:hypothetical protein
LTDKKIRLCISERDRKREGVKGKREKCLSICVREESWVRERERKRKRERERRSVCLCVYMYLRECVCL